MTNPLKQQWQSLKRGKPGHRFRARYDAGSRVKKDASFGFKLIRLLRFVIALAAAAVGVVLVFIPGPAILFFLLAGSLLAAESLTIARFLDWIEVKLRDLFEWCQRQWRRMHPAGKIAITGLAATGATGCVYAAYRLVAD
ncbi:MAG TPA: hypothetical protein VGM64_20260 [Lacunisphaera sp.]|jgi:hypothetical protein